MDVRFLASLFQILVFLAPGRKELPRKEGRKEECSNGRKEASMIERERYFHGRIVWIWGGGDKGEERK